MAMDYADFARELRDLGDPLADEVVKELLDDDQVNSVNNLFRQIDTADSQIPAQTPAVLREYFETTREFPDWVEDTRLADTADFFRHHHLPASAMQATVGLVGTYLSPVGAYTLHSTHQLSHQPHRRLSQSTRIFMGMGDSDAFTDHSKLVPTCQKVRLVHAAIRELHRRSGEWDYDGMGAPVSQLYTAGAALVFSVGVLDGMENIGLSVDQNEAEGFMYSWAIVAHFLGVPDKYIKEAMSSHGRATELWHEGREYEWAPSDEGRILTRECIDLYESYMPPGFEGAVPAFLRQALTDRFADMVDVPTSAFDLGADAATLGTATLLGGPVGHNPVSDEVVGHLGKAVERVCREAFTAGQETEPQMADRIG
ncbi:oxygenase MpaB family protein [Streptomonospora litoralis]|uniref:Latex clearing protein n=1 Tax=Streptomonospora litoralis TaxID=2498135 RepID=A0A4P6Q5I6_9ACTN|nr:oxygenase MpaB family protein [Streptomonospora litoralis]QBI55540.1 Latex clearing protein precursor [Streptomonospora litoralis]